MAPATKPGSWLAVALIAAFLLFRFFLPQLQQNEGMRLAASRHLLDSSFLAQDWSHSAGVADARLYLLFDSLTVPLWIALKKAMLVALAGRLAVWAFLLFAIAGLAQEIGLPWYSLGFGMLAWLYSGQSMGASEWIFAGFESKCVAYGFLFLALRHVLREEVFRAAIECGVAICFHSLVGGWGTAAIGGALLLRRSDYEWRKFGQFAGITAMFALPSAVAALSYLRAAGSPTPDVDRLIVFFRAPHHLDPDFFGGWREAVILAGMTAIGSLGLKRIVSREQSGFLRSFLLMLLLQFCAGLTARMLGWLWFLKLYPFRVADVLVPLLFWLVLPFALAHIWRRMAFSANASRALATATALGIVVFALHRPPSPRHVWDEARAHTDAWRGYVSGTQESWQRMAAWIRTQTPHESVILAPPWLDDFWLETERAELVNFKDSPHNAAIQEWYRRMAALNGGTFHTVGFGIPRELREHYLALTPAQLQAIAEEYGARYYLTTAPRDDLKASLVHANSEYWLYRLR